VKYYINEYNKKNIGKVENINNIFTLINNENYEYILLKNQKINIQKKCVKLIKYNNSVENNFLC